MKNPKFSLLLPLALVTFAVLAGCSNPAMTMDGGTDSRVIIEDGETAPQCISAPDPSPADGPCRCNTDCIDGTVCQTEETNGIPMGRCVAPCTTTAQCGAGYVCGSDGLCLQTCTAPGQCLSGRYCASGRCLPLCARDADCFSGHCNPWTTRCTPTAPETPSGGRTDDACLIDEDCRSRFCVSGTCLNPCTTTSPFCPENEGCYAPSPQTIELGLCIQNCADGSPCRNPALHCIRVPELNGQYCN